MAGQSDLDRFEGISLLVETLLICLFTVSLRQIEQLRRSEIITEQEVKQLCLKAREILAEESNVQRIDTPVTVGYNFTGNSPVVSISKLLGLWGHPRAVLRLEGAVSSGRRCP